MVWRIESRSAELAGKPVAMLLDRLFPRSLPPALAKRLPHHPVPAAVLGRLAIDREQQGRGLGETLLLDAIRRVLRANKTIAVYAIIVDAKNESAQAFHERYGFRAFAGEPRRLFLPLETFEKLGL